jgi:trigger factor
LKVDIQDVSSCKKTFRIEIPVEEVNEEFEKAYEEVRKNIEVPGFRKGRAPRNILRMRFGEYVKHEVIEKLVPSAYEKAVEDSKLVVIGLPDINPPAEEILFSIETDIQNDLDNEIIPEVLKEKFKEKDISIQDKVDFSVDETGKKWTLTEGKKKYLISKEDEKINVRTDQLDVKENEPFIFEAEVNIKPEINIPDYSLLEIVKGDVNVTKEDVDQFIEQLRDKRADFVPVEDRPIQAGDYAHFILKVSQEDKVIEESEDAVLEIKEGNLLPELFQNLIGMNIGEEKEVNITLPEDHSNKQLAGKETKFYLKLVKNTEKHLPNLDDDFAKDQGEESLEQLTAKVWNHLVESKRQQRKEETEGELISQLIEKTQFEISDSLIEDQTKRFTKGQTNLTDENIASYRSLAERIIRRTWIIDAIAEREDINVSEEEVEAEVTAMANARDKDPQKYMSQLKAANRIEAIKDSLKEGKVFRMLMDKASEKKTLIV